MSALRLISNEKDLVGKTVLLRIDSDVDIESDKILDDTRLLSSLETLKYLLNNGAMIIIIGHLGRPEKTYKIENIKNQKIDTSVSLKVISDWFVDKLGTQAPSSFVSVGNFPAWQISSKITILENIRLFEGEEDPSTSSGQVLAKELANLGQLFVNDAFAVSHRNHVSVATLASMLPSFAGFHMQKEIEVLSSVIENPKRPLVVLIGGAKIETKLPMVEKMHKVADYVLVGGEIAEQDKILIQVQHEKIEGKKSAVLVAEMTPSRLDITQKSVENFIQIINLASTIIWNGPVGLIGEDPVNEEGTKRLAQAITEASAYKVVGGGDSLTILKRLGLLDKFDFVSTGGGAMLEFLSGKELPGIKPLQK